VPGAANEYALANVANGEVMADGFLQEINVKTVVMS